MFKNTEVKRMLELENAICNYESVISDAEYYGNTDDTAMYYSGLEKCRNELATLRHSHKNNLSSDYELVYTC